MLFNTSTCNENNVKSETKSGIHVTTIYVELKSLKNSFKIRKDILMKEHEAYFEISTT